MNLQPPDPPEYGHCLTCNRSVHESEVHAVHCIECEGQAMTNKTAELLKRFDSLDVDDFQGWANEAADLLRALLAAPVVERQEPVPKSEWDVASNPVLGYADSYRQMARTGTKSVDVWSIITDLERNIAPLFSSPPAPVAVAVDEGVEFEKWWCRTPALRKSKLQMAQEAWEARACLDNKDQTPCR